MPFFLPLLLLLLATPLFGQVRAKTFFELIPPDAITSSAVDSAGNIYVTGFTAQDIVPVTPNAFQPKFIPLSCGDFLLGSLSCGHSFVAKVSGDGTTLVYATYLEGSTGSDIASSIAVDSAGNAYVAGTTSSTDFPLGVGAYQRTPAEGFVAKLNAAGSALIGSTYVSGAILAAIAIDAAGNAYVTGRTTAKVFATTPDAFQTLPRGDTDAFVLKLDPTLRTAVYSTILGGGSADSGRAIAVDAQGNAYITGATISLPRTGIVSDPNPLAPFPTTAGAYGHPQLRTDVFVTKLSPDGSRLVFSSVIGGGADEAGQAIAVDSSGAVYVSGVTSSSDLAASPWFVFTVPSGFALKLSADASKLVYLTYLPGPASLIVPPRFQIALNGDHLVVRSYSEKLVPTTPDSPNPCRSETDVIADRSNQEFVMELSSDATSTVYSTYLHYTVAVTGDAFWTAQGNPNQLLVRTPLHTAATAGTATCVANAATFLKGKIAGGEIVSIFGSKIGPAVAVSGQLDASGKFPTSLGGVVVKFNGEPAPLLYVSSSQINAVVPFAVAGTFTSQMQILKDGAPLNALGFEVAATVPGIFAVVNSNGTISDTTHPALLGTTIAVFATGAGLMNPVPADGTLGKGTTKILGEVTAMLRTNNLFPGQGGVVAGLVAPLEVTYAGDAPGNVQGLVQINLKLPPNFIQDNDLLFVGIGSAGVQVPIRISQRPD